MKAFSRVPDPFGEHLQTGKFQFPIKTAIRIEAIPQGKFHHNLIQIGAQAHHIINPNQHKRGVLSLDMSEQLKDEMGKESQNTAMTEGNPTSKELEGKQKLVEVEKCASEKGQKCGKLFSCEDVNIGMGSEKIMQASSTKRLQVSQQQKIGNLPLQSNSKHIVSPIVSHIVFSFSQQQVVRGILHKRPIFSKDKQVSPVQKNLIKEQKVHEPIMDIRIDEKCKQTKEAQQFLDEKEAQVEENIECSFFNNSIEKEGEDGMKDTGFNLIESVVNIFKDQPKRPKSKSLLNEKAQKQKHPPNHIDLSFMNENGRLKNLGGIKLNGSRVSQKSSLQPAKLQLIKPITINPVFF